MKKIYLYCILACYLLAATNLSATKQQKGAKKTSRIENTLLAKGLVDIHTLDPSIRVELKYATTDNFTQTLLYDSLTIAYLHPLAAHKLAKAQQELKKRYPNLSLLVYDAARPLQVQQKMYKQVQNTPFAAYVANPARRGLHNYGMAVDLTICDAAGKPLDMGTAFDFFGKAAGIKHESQLVAQSILTNTQVYNRKLLRQVMLEAGFATISGEWWHFNAVTLAHAKDKYRVIP